MRDAEAGVIDSDEKEVASHLPDWNYRGENGGDTIATPHKTGPRACCRDANSAHSALLPGYTTLPA